MILRAFSLSWLAYFGFYSCRKNFSVLMPYMAKTRRQWQASSRHWPRGRAGHAMGLLKIDQIREILCLPRVAGAWNVERGGNPGENDDRELVESFLPLQMDVIEERSKT